MQSADTKDWALENPIENTPILQDLDDEAVRALIEVSNASNSFGSEFEAYVEGFLRSEVERKAVWQMYKEDYTRSDFTLIDFISADALQNGCGDKVSVPDGISIPDFIGVFSDENGVIYLASLDAKYSLNAVSFKQISINNLRKVCSRNLIPNIIGLSEAENFLLGEFITIDESNNREIEARWREGKYKSERARFIEYSSVDDPQHSDLVQYLSAYFYIQPEDYPSLITNSSIGRNLNKHSPYSLGMVLVAISVGLKKLYPEGKLDDIYEYIEYHRFDSVGELVTVLKNDLAQAELPNMLISERFMHLFNDFRAINAKGARVSRDELDASALIFRNVLAEMLETGDLPFEHLPLAKRKVGRAIVNEICNRSTNEKTPIMPANIMKSLVRDFVRDIFVAARI